MMNLSNAHYNQPSVNQMAYKNSHSHPV